MPTFLLGGWFDLLLGGTIASYQALVANAPDERAARAHIACSSVRGDIACTPS